MTESFIDKVKKNILHHISNEKFGVTELASEMGLSRSQVLRKVKASAGKSVNQLIRETRLEEAIKLLRDENLTASEIAYKVGFSSPSYFNKCFLDQFGVPPGEYKKKFEKEDLTELTSINKSIKRSFISKPIFFGFIVIILIITGYFLILNPKTESLNQHSSIAVLPLLNLSENQDKDYLADGITEAITLELSKIESLRVISRGSAMKYKGDKKMYPEIAKELGVDLLLEGSVLRDADSLRVVVQLIEPFPKEKHIWANSYDQRSTNVLQLVGEVSNEIASEISSVVEPKSNEMNTNEIRPEAYDLYLRGRHLWNTQKTRYNSLLKALVYLDEAVRIDPKFAQAYVTQAETYLAINTLISDNEEKFGNREKARQSVKKALELDPSLAEAYITSGNLSGKFDWDWEKMKDLVEKGLNIDPNNPDGHIALSNYYVVKGYYKKAIDEALIAENLDPLNPVTGCAVAERYYIAGNYKQSIEKYNEVLEMDPDYGFALHGIGYVYYYSGDRAKSLNSWLQLQRVMGNDSLAWYYTNGSLEDGLHFYLKQVKKETPRFCSNPVIISSVQMMVDEKNRAIDYLKIACQYKNEDLPVMITYPDFYSLRNDPAFKEIANKVRVIFPN